MTAAVTAAASRAGMDTFAVAASLRLWLLLVTPRWHALVAPRECGPWAEGNYLQIVFLKLIKKPTRRSILIGRKAIFFWAYQTAQYGRLMSLNDLLIALLMHGWQLIIQTGRLFGWFILPPENSLFDVRRGEP